MIERFATSLPTATLSSVFAVRNDYFGGNVDVAGLLTATDVLAQLPTDLQGTVVLLPDVMFNADRLTLDGSSAAGLCSALEARGARALVLPSGPREIAQHMVDL